MVSRVGNFELRSAMFRGLTLRVGRPGAARLEWVKRRLEGFPATASPLSQWGQFPIFTGVRLSRTGRPPMRCLVPSSYVRVGLGGLLRSHSNGIPMVVAVKDSIRNSPSFLSNVPSRIRYLSVDHFRVNFMQRTRVRIHLSSFW